MQGWLLRHVRSKEAAIRPAKTFIRARCAVAFRKGKDCLVYSGKSCGTFRHLFGNIGVAQRYLIEHRSGNTGKMLFNTTYAGSSLAVRNVRNVNVAYGDFPRFGFVKSEKQTENSALACAGSADERDLLAFFTVIEKFCNTGFSPYPNVTSESTTSPCAAVFLSFGRVRSF